MNSNPELCMEGDSGKHNSSLTKMAWHNPACQLEKKKEFIIRIQGLLTELRTGMKLGLSNSQKQEFKHHQGSSISCPSCHSLSTDLLLYLPVLLQDTYANC